MYFFMCTCGIAELSGDSSAGGSVALSGKVTMKCFKILLSLFLSQSSGQPDGFGFSVCFGVPMAAFQTAQLPGASWIPQFCLNLLLDRVISVLSPCLQPSPVCCLRAVLGTNKKPCSETAFAGQT